jgi:LysM repeat protein
MRLLSFSLVVGLATTAFAVPHTSQGSCDSSSLNSTSFVYTTTSEDTIFSIAKKFDRGACDIARANRMIDAEHLFEGFTLLIPGQVCNPDSNTCLLTRQHATATCVKGGPHDYKTIAGDTIEKIALYKLNVTVETVFSEASQAGISSTAEEIPAGTFIKIRQCVPSACTVTPFHFTYGVYKDLAERFGTTVGQIMSFNGAYNYSDHSDADAAWITVPMGCTNLALNVTEEI